MGCDLEIKSECDKMKCVAILLLSASVALAAPLNPWNKITGGENAEQGQFPYQISLEWGVAGIYQHVCGGIIISQDWVLTAGHCITELPMPGDMRIRAGILKLTEAAPQVINVVERIPHPNYAGGVNPNDIALLKLESSLEFDDLVQAAKLPESGAEPTGQSVLSGWGSTSTGIFPIMPNTLQTVELPIIPFEECAAALEALMGTSEPLVESNVCTGPLSGGLSACSGDSGGPLAQDGTVIGIVSWGIIPCGSVGAPSVYTQVSDFKDFISEYTGL